METIELVSSARNLVGADLGLKYRQEYLIDAFDFGNPVTIHIPDNIYSISSSFIIGMFEDSMDQFSTMDEFMNHYCFDCNTTVFKCITNGVYRLYNRRYSG